jgi:methionyl-tRNA formyltransferase
VSLRREKGGADAHEVMTRLHAVAPDLLVVAAYGLLLPPDVLDVPLGVAGRGALVRAINIHASLLPRWRGAAPVARAIEAGDPVTGITLMQMDAGLDTGPILRSEPTSIGPTETTGTLTLRLAELGARLVVTALGEAPHATWSPAPQPAQGVTYARKIDRHEAWLDWSAPADALARRVRAFDPDPGACGRLGGSIVKIWSAGADFDAPGGEPGTVVSASADGIGVACGQGVLRIGELQRAGGRRLTARDFLAGMPVRPGAHWEVPVASSGSR